MSRWENWIEQQQRTVEPDGVASATIRLEGPDGAVWGTWPTKSESLTEVIEQTIELLVDDLPKERHGCYLVSYDVKGQQLAKIPHVVFGRSAEAAKQGNRERAQAQATSVHLANAEQVLGIQSRQLLKLAEQSTNEVEDNLLLRQKLVELMTETLANRTQERLAEEKLAMWKELASTCKPLLEATVGIVAQLGMYKFEEFFNKLKATEAEHEKRGEELKAQAEENERMRAELAKSSSS